MKKYKQKILKLFLTINIFFFTFVYSANALSLYNPLGSKDLSIPQLIGKFIAIFINIVGAIALLMVIYGGFLWLTSRGDSGQIKKGKDTLVWAGLGLVLIFSARAILTLFFSTIG